jgi:hypothetical protein
MQKMKGALALASLPRCGRCFAVLGLRPLQPLIRYFRYYIGFVLD